MRKSVCLSLLAILPIVATASPLPPEVAKERDALIREGCEAGRPIVRAGLLQSADFNGDGKPDYVLDGNGFDCKGDYNRGCGSGGCNIDVYLSTPSGAYRSANLNRLGGQSSIDRRGSRATLVMPGRHGTTRYRWNGQALVAID